MTAMLLAVQDRVDRFENVFSGKSQSAGRSVARKASLAIDLRFVGHANSCSVGQCRVDRIWAWPLMARSIGVWRFGRAVSERDLASLRRCMCRAPVTYW